MKSKSAGFSILELILAMSMLSIILWGASKLESSAVRLSTNDIGSMEMQNQLFYAFRILDKDMGTAETINILKLPDPATAASSLVQLYSWKIHPVNMADTSQDITYTIDLQNTKGVFQKTVGTKTTHLVSPGKLTLGSLKDVAAPNNKMAVWMTNGFKLMTVSLGLDCGANCSKSQPLYTRSFWIRSAKVSDCRSGICL